MGWILISVKDFSDFFCCQTIDLVKIMVLVLLNELLFDLIKDFLTVALSKGLDSLHSFVYKVD